MGLTIKPITWLDNNLDNNSKPQSDRQQVIIIDDIPVPADFRLSPEEYKKLYEARLKNDEEMPATPEEYKKAYTSGTEKRLFSLSWLSGSIDTNPQQADSEPVKIIEERPAATLELDPEEYRRIREELEEERALSNCTPEQFYGTGAE